MSEQPTLPPLAAARRRLERGTRQPIDAAAGQCPTPTAAGAPCKGKPTASGYCVSHSEEHAGLLAEARRKGGRLVAARRALQRAREHAIDTLGVSEELPDLADMARMQKYLVSVALRVENRTLSPAQGNTLVAVARLAKDCVSLATEIELLRQLEAQRDAG